MSTSERETVFYCFCGPSGSGKSSICRKLVAEDPNLLLSVSTTTRSARAGEKDGVDYFFVTEDEFSARLSRGDFAEWAEYGGFRYGTERRNMRLASDSGRDLLLDIDVQGVRQVRRLYGDRVVVVFVSPPTLRELEARLSARGSESREKIAERLYTAKREIEVLGNPEFSDYVVVNEGLEEAADLAKKIVDAERARLRRFNEPFFAGLRSAKSDPR